MFPSRTVPPPHVRIIPGRLRHSAPVPGVDAGADPVEYDALCALPVPEATVTHVQAIAHVHEEWQRPAHDWARKTGWRLFNAATHALTGKVVENPKGTAALHQVIGQVCGIAA
jgi:hypothetical protein